MRRLRPTLVPVAVLLSGCADVQPPVAVDDHLLVGGHSAESSLGVADPLQSSRYPNEPKGFVRITELDGSVVPGGGRVPGWYGPKVPGNTTLILVSSAPLDQRVLRSRMRKCELPYQHWGITVAPGASPRKREYYSVVRNSRVVGRVRVDSVVSATQWAVRVYGGSTLVAADRLVPAAGGATTRYRSAFHAPAPHMKWKCEGGGIRGGVGGENFGTSVFSEQKAMYFSHRFRLVGPDFETQGTTGMKWGYWNYGDRKAVNVTSMYLEPAVATAKNEGFSKVASSFRFRKSFASGKGPAYKHHRLQNRNLGKVIQAGKWHHLEMVIAMSDVDQHNGWFRIWLDGVKTHEYTGLRTRHSATNFTAGLFQFKWHTIFGGTAGYKTRTDFIDTAHWYISGIPLAGANRIGMESFAEDDAANEDEEEEEQAEYEAWYEAEADALLP